MYVAIDRATRLMIYKVYESKTSENTDEFATLCKELFHFQITHILTDNGLEFTNRLLVLKTGKQCTKPSLLDKFCDKEKIEHRLTKPNHPQTNGMVEKVNDTIKNVTILIEQYPNKNAMESSLKKFLLFILFIFYIAGIMVFIKN